MDLLKLLVDRFNGKKIPGENLVIVVGRQMTPSNRTIANRHWLDTMPVENVAHG